MVTGKRALITIGIAAVLLPTTGCANNSQPTSLTPAEWATTAGADLNCPDQAIVRPGMPPQYYDISGDGTSESFVDFICAGVDTATAPDQLEIFQGTSRSSRLARLTSIAAPSDEHMFMAHGCMYFTGNKVIVIGQTRSGADPVAPPNQLAVQVSTWTNGKIITGRPVAGRDARNLPPGCP